MPAPNGRAVTNGDLIKTAERRAFVLNLRRAGATYRQIAEQAIRHFGMDQLPLGWDCRYAYKDCMRELEKLREDIGEAVEDVRTLELDRLDALLVSLWRIAMPTPQPDDRGIIIVPTDDARFKAIDRILRIMERRTALVPDLSAPQAMDLNLGDAPIRITECVVELTHGPDDEPDYNTPSPDNAPESMEV